MRKICVLGSGSWGTALALVLASNDYNVSMWTLNKDQSKYINEYKENKDYLPGVVIPENINVTTDIQQAVEGSSIVVLGVPSQAIRSVCEKIKPYIKESQIIVDVAKGIEKSTSLRLSEVCKEVLPNNPYVVLSGPSHAEEVARQVPTAVVVSSEDVNAAKSVQDAFKNSYFRVYQNHDVVGVELGGTLKNIIAFGAGICDGVGYGDNTKAALITRGMRELTRLGCAMGADESTFTGLAGMGDLIVTCTSMHSRNRRAGILIGKGKSLDETLEEVQMVVEGITATEVAYNLSKEYGVDMPIVEAIYSILYNNANPKEVVEELMSRKRVYEIDNLEK